ncbi:hypothetical protein PtA15_1A209 [Puccinia triticina]|uniref:Signal peptidase complex catalytic subunit SEC11 n=1 Tax=Puccinia triticina TaxID=208348 RepID=A0ABY7C6S6_9BASI|nr:uncharacterized protein PtA15_1A209 [Puccinia triticina]WAQ80871.1 hypothetical protein PtA15_1A209 [Puccinia triticina]WAR51766.1 hypothetical protein PtB15_1B202 [Puccinia triticina]
MFEQELATIRRLGIRHILLQGLNFATVICTALMLWKGLAVALNTESPVVVVLSGSMEPGFYRGDLLFLSLPRDRQLKVGEIPVFNVPEGKIPIVHRLIENHDEPKASATKKDSDFAHLPTRWMLTKGDNNHENDVALYNGLKYLQRSNLIGKVNGYVPHVGYVTIVMNDYPKLKYALLGVLGLTILLHRE